MLTTKASLKISKITLFTLLLLPSLVLAKESPCAESLNYLDEQYQLSPVTRNAFDKVYAGLTDLPDGYSYNHSRVNPWKAAGSGKKLHSMMKEMFRDVVVK